MARRAHPRSPGSPAFETCYQSLLAASTAAEVERIRDRTTKQHKRHDYFGADAIMAWASIPLDELLQRQ